MGWVGYGGSNGWVGCTGIKYSVCCAHTCLYEDCPFNAYRMCTAKSARIAHVVHCCVATTTKLINYFFSGLLFYVLVKKSLVQNQYLCPGCTVRMRSSEKHAFLVEIGASSNLKIPYVCTISRYVQSKIGPTSTSLIIDSTISFNTIAASGSATGWTAKHAKDWDHTNRHAPVSIRVQQHYIIIAIYICTVIFLYSRVRAQVQTT